MQACEHGPRLDDPGDGNRGAFSRGLQTSIHTDLSPYQPGSCSSRYVADVAQGGPGIYGMDNWGGSTPNSNQKAKRNIISCFSGGKRVVLQTVWKPCKPVSMMLSFSLRHVSHKVCTPRDADPYLILPELLPHNTTATSTTIVVAKEASEWTDPARQSIHQRAR
jgi:hypothetical protein